MTEPILRLPFDIFFTFNPSLFFLEGLGVIAAALNAILGLFGVPPSVVAF